MEKPVDMKLSKSEMKDTAPTVAGSSNKGPKYPWGLELRLDDASLKKLGMDKEMPEVGELCQITGVGRVVSCSMSESSMGGSSKNVTIQIERMTLAVDDEDEAFEKGYKKGGNKHRGY